MAISQEIIIILPHQLFEHEFKNKGKKYVVWEHPYFFTKYTFHVQKLIYHRATLKRFASQLKKNNTVEYVEFHEYENLKELLSSFKRPLKIHYYDLLEKQLINEFLAEQEKAGYTLVTQNSPLFLLSDEDRAEYLAEKGTMRMASFYEWHRKRSSILMDGDRPEGGKWSFDLENRKKLPKDMVVPETRSQHSQGELSYLKEARQYVSKHFPKNYGTANIPIFPISHKTARTWLDTFAKEKLEHFGPYQDAITENESYLFHSVLSPMINIGLLNPQEVLDVILEVHKKRKAPLSSIEGFVRQLIGWREFVYLTYQERGKEMMSTNYLKHSRKLPVSFWEGGTGLPPFDNAFKRVKETAYAHHIERLMIFGNVMLLLEVNPEEVFEWFMIFFIDAYEWVMVPNVYDMSQFAGGGVFATKPYVSGSNYIRKMSAYKKGEWSEYWDVLYWAFIHNHSKLLEKNPRMSLIISQAKKRNKKQDIEKAREYIENVYA